MALLDLAAIDAPEESELTDREVDQKVAKHVRSADPRVSMAAAELYDKRKQRREAATANQPEETLEENLVALVAAVPMQAAGACMALSSFASAGGNIANLFFIKDVASTVAHYYPDYWAKWLAGNRQREFLEKLASAPVLSDDELVAAVKAKLGVKAKPEAVL